MTSGLILLRSSQQWNRANSGTEPPGVNQVLTVNGNSIQSIEGQIVSLESYHGELQCLI